MKLGDILVIQEKSKIKAGDGIDNGNFPFFTCSNDVVKTYNSAQYKGPALIFGTGGKASVHFCSEDFSTSTDCLVYKTNKDVNLSLINKYLRTNMYLLENGFKGAGLKHISRDYIADIELSLPSFDNQNKLVKIFDLIESNIVNLKGILNKYDILIKSRFIEMFGDIQKYIKEPFKDCSLFIDYRGHTPEVAEQGHIRMVNAKSVGKGFFKYVNEYVTEEIYDSWMHRGFPKANDVLFVTEGHTFGNTCQVPANINKFALGQRVITIRGNDNKLNNFFLNAYMQTDDFYKDITKYKTGGTAQGIRSKDLLKVEIPLPPIKLQNDFSTFVQQIDKSKFEYTYTGVAA